MSKFKVSYNIIATDGFSKIAKQVEKSIKSLEKCVKTLRKSLKELPSNIKPIKIKLAASKLDVSKIKEKLKPIYTNVVANKFDISKIKNKIKIIRVNLLATSLDSSKIKLTKKINLIASKIDVSKIKEKLKPIKVCVEVTEASIKKAVKKIERAKPNIKLNVNAATAGSMPAKEWPMKKAQKVPLAPVMPKMPSDFNKLGKLKPVSQVVRNLSGSLTSSVSSMKELTKASQMLAPKLHTIGGAAIPIKKMSVQTKSVASSTEYATQKWKKLGKSIFEVDKEFAHFADEFAMSQYYKFMNVGLPIMGIAIPALKDLSQVQDANVNLKATVSNFEELNSQAEDFGRKTKYSVADIKKVQASLAAQGISGKDIKKALPGILNYAASAGISVGQAAQQVVQASLKGGEIGTTDVVVRGGTKASRFARGAAALQKELAGRAIQQAGTVSGKIDASLKNLNQDFSETFQAIGQPIASAIQALEGFVYAISEFLKKHTTLAKAIGVIVTAVGLFMAAGIAASVVVGGLSAALSSVLLPFRGISKVLGFFGGKVGPVEMVTGKFSERLTSARHALKKANVQLARAGGHFKRYGKAMQDYTAPAFRKFKGLAKSSFSVVKNVAASGFSVLKNGVTLMARSFMAAIPSVLSFGAALLANPITWIVLGIIAVGVAIYEMIKHWDAVKKAFISAWGWIKSHLLIILSPIGLIIKGIKLLYTHWDSIKKAIQHVYDVVVGKLLKGFDKVISVFKKAGHWFSSIFGGSDKHTDKLKKNVALVKKGTEHAKKMGVTSPVQPVKPIYGPGGAANQSALSPMLNVNQQAANHNVQIHVKGTNANVVSTQIQSTGNTKNSTVSLGTNYSGGL